MPARSGLVWKDPPGADDRRGFCHHYASARAASRYGGQSVSQLMHPLTRARARGVPGPGFCGLRSRADRVRTARMRPSLIRTAATSPLPSPTVGASPAVVSADIPQRVAPAHHPNRAATARNRARALSSSSAMVAAISAGGGRLAGSVAPSSRNHDRFRSRRSRAANSA